MAQTISVTLTKGKKYRISYQKTTNTFEICYIDFVYDGKEKVLLFEYAGTYPANYTYYGCTYTRDCTIKAKGLLVGRGICATSGGMSDDNSRIIPLALYEIKGA